jgi:hypothetical protein
VVRAVVILGGDRKLTIGTVHVLPQVRRLDGLHFDQPVLVVRECTRAEWLAFVEADADARWGAGQWPPGERERVDRDEQPYYYEVTTD